MALERTALRLAVKQALLAEPAIAGLCGSRVFDSRISQLSANEPVPVIVVLTEDASGSATDRQNGGPPFFDQCDLVLEISLRVTAPSANDDGTDVLLVETDREAEGLLDLLEHSAIEAVTVADTPESRLVRTAVTRRVREYKSVRFTSDETALKLAVRLVSLTVEIKGDVQDHAFDVPTGPYANLPEPLRSVARAMPEGSSARDTCDRIAARLAGAPEPEPFRGVDMTFAPRDLDPGAAPQPDDDRKAGRLVRTQATIPSGAAP